MTGRPDPAAGRLPTPPELEQAPELAVLVALDSTLEIAACAVRVAHPEIDEDPECPYWVAGPEGLAAEKLLELIDLLRAAIDRYRETLPEPPPVEHVPDNPFDDDPSGSHDPADDIPF